MNNIVENTLLIILIFASTFIFLSMIPPTVVFDYKTNQCVEVIGGHDGQTCENLPRKYNHKWRM